MEKFLKENGFVKVPKRGKHVKSIYCCPEKDIFLTIFQNGDWNVSKPGSEDLSELESWTSRFSELFADMSQKS